MDNKDKFNNIAFTETKTQSDILADRIKSMISSKELEEGYQFPNENEFCRILNVGRGTLREAYMILDSHGYIRRTKHGTFVRKKEEIARQGNFLASLELAETREMVEFVCALEPEAVFLAAKRIDEQQLKEIYELIQECKKNKDDPKKISECNYRLHEYIRNASGNQLIISALTAYYDIFNQQVIQHIYSDQGEGALFLENALRQHEELWIALKHHDAEAARKITYEHLLADVEYRLSIQID